MNIEWDARGYGADFSFVPQYGAAVMDLITARGGTAVDLGCGRGALTGRLAERSFRVVGIDDSQAMLAAARESFPELEFRQGDAVTFRLAEPVDLIFSNAVFHWIDADKQAALLNNIAANLKPGGELVTEFGGYGCAETVHSTLERVFERHGLDYPRVFYFPTIGEYAPMLEQAGLRVEVALLFDRPTPQKGADGVADWIKMFVKKPFENIAPKLAAEIIRETADECRGALYRDGTWYVDYVRIRLRARKIS